MDEKISMSKLLSGFSCGSVKDSLDESKIDQLKLISALEEKSEMFNFNLLGSVKQFL